MFKLDLNQNNYQDQLKPLLQRWNDHSNVIRPLVIVKVSQAFTMYHQIVRDNWTIQNHNFRNLHPVMINDLETGFSVILALDTAGRILHCYLIKDNGSLCKADQLLRFAHKTKDQEYLDYFYCISKNLQRYLDNHADAVDK